jgi:hypothetical protein
MAVKLPSNQEDREAYLREHRAGEFVKAVGEARRQSAGSVMLTIVAFAGEPEARYVALDYASDCGVAITMTPLGMHDRNRA